MSKWNYMGLGIPDEFFIQSPGVPITKSEIRALVLAKLKLYPGIRLYDLGCGSGSVSIEAKLLMPSARVIGFDRDPAAIDLSRKNSEAFEAALELIQGEVPGCLQGMEKAERIFIGGSGGRIEDVLEACHDLLLPEGRIVLTAVTIDTLPRAREVLQRLSYRLEMLQINVAAAKSAGEQTIWQGRNPVSILVADNVRS